MGVKNLTAYLADDRAPKHRQATPLFQEERWYVTASQDASRVVVVDGAAFCYAALDWATPVELHALGGQYAALRRSIAKFCKQCANVGCKLVFVFGGTPQCEDHAKNGETNRRLVEGIFGEKAITEALSGGAPLRCMRAPIAPSKAECAQAAVLKALEALPLSVEIIVTDDEDDAAVAYEAASRNAWVLTNDSDMLVYDYSAVGEIRGVVFFKTTDRGDNLRFDDANNSLRFEATHPSRVAEAVGVPRQRLGVFATALGNDYLPEAALTTLHDTALRTELHARKTAWYDLELEKSRAVREKAAEASKGKWTTSTFACDEGMWCKRKWCPKTHPRGGHNFCGDVSGTSNRCIRPFTCGMRHAGDLPHVAVECRAVFVGGTIHIDRLAKACLAGVDGVEDVVVTDSGDEKMPDATTLKVFCSTIATARDATSRLAHDGIRAYVAKELKWAIIRGVANLVQSMDLTQGVGLRISAAAKLYEPRQARLGHFSISDTVTWRADSQAENAGAAVIRPSNAESRLAAMALLPCVRDLHRGRMFGTAQYLKSLLDAFRFALFHGPSATATAWTFDAATSTVRMARDAVVVADATMLSDIIKGRISADAFVLKTLGAGEALDAAPAMLKLPLAALRFWVVESGAASAPTSAALPPPRRLSFWQVRVVVSALVQCAVEASVVPDGDEPETPNVAPDARLTLEVFEILLQWAELLQALAELSAAAALGDAAANLVRPDLFDGHVLYATYEVAAVRRDNLCGETQAPTPTWVRHAALAPKAAAACALVDALCGLVTAGLESNLAGDDRLAEALPVEDFTKLTVDDAADNWDDSDDDESPAAEVAPDERSASELWEAVVAA
ncbi:hypothetical protein M885DRAFT_588712 [Pelagophyceae sp. CCMP2097]|nr:hypothetical protein M885DRAFT_588712 [Pelagophyceae sp. CCMP2097]